MYNRFNSNIRKYNFTVRTVKAWNSLPQSIIDSENIIQFEKQPPIVEYINQLGFGTLQIWQEIQSNKPEIAFND